MNKAGYCLFVSDIPAAFKTCFIYLFTFQTSLLLFYKLHKVWMSNLPPEGGNNFKNIKFNVNPNKSLALQVKMCENNCPCNIFTSGDRFWNKKLITWSWNLFQRLAQICIWTLIPPWFSCSSDEVVVAPWAKPEQRRANVESEKVEDEMREEEIEEEQWCGAPECDQR